MPNTTPNFALPYPAASDQPCDFDEQWCDFTEAVDGVFATFEAGIARTMPTVPLAIVQQSIQRTVENIQPVPFDAVTADTANMTDIDSDPFSITISRIGRYSISAGIEMGSSGNVNSQTTLLVGSDSFTLLANALDRGVSFVYRMNAYSPVVTLTPGEKIRLSFNVGVQTNIIVFTSWMAAVWHSDAEVP